LAASQGDATFMTGDDLTADPESEPSSGGSLCGVEGLKECALGSRAHAATCVSYYEAYSGRASSGIRGTVNTNEKASACRHGVKRICYKVDDDLTKLTMIAVKRIDRVVAFFEDDAAGRQPTYVE